jgi:hypothetical protein
MSCARARVCVCSWSVDVRRVTLDDVLLACTGDVEFDVSDMCVMRVGVRSVCEVMSACDIVQI